MRRLWLVCLLVALCASTPALAAPPYTSQYDAQYATDKASIDSQAASPGCNNGQCYYRMNYTLHSLIKMYEATGLTSYLTTAQTLINTMISKATVVDQRGFLNWPNGLSAPGPRCPCTVTSPTTFTNIFSDLQSFQAAEPFAYYAYVVLTRQPALLAYKDVAEDIRDWTAQHIFERERNWQNDFATERTRLSHWVEAKTIQSNNNLIHVPTSNLLSAYIWLRATPGLSATHQTNADSFLNYAIPKLIPNHPAGWGYPNIGGVTGAQGWWGATSEAPDTGSTDPGGAIHVMDSSHGNHYARLVMAMYITGRATLAYAQGWSKTYESVVYDGSAAQPRYMNWMDGQNLAWAGINPWGATCPGYGWNWHGAIWPGAQTRNVQLADAMASPGGYTGSSTVCNSSGPSTMKLGMYAITTWAATDPFGLINLPPQAIQSITVK